MLKAYSKFLDNSEKFIGVIIVALLAVAFLIIFAQVVIRYVFKSGFPWMEESARYMIIWMSCLGASIAVRKKRHMSIDVLEVRFPPRLRKTMSFILDLAVLAFFIIIIIVGTKYALRNTENRSPGLNLRLTYVYFSIVFGMALSVLYAIEQMWITLTKYFSQNTESLQ